MKNLIEQLECLKDMSGPVVDAVIDDAIKEIEQLESENEKQRSVISDYYNHCKNDMQICGINTRAKQILERKAQNEVV